MKVQHNTGKAKSNALEALADTSLLVTLTLTIGLNWSYANYYTLQIKEGW